MASAINKVSSVLRIVRGERDALVRTAHFKAASENVSFATIERKIMSTKTTFKRVALVAVASLGFGVLSSVAPASATTWSAINGNQMQYINAITLAQVTTSPTVGSAVIVNFGTSIGAGDTNTTSGRVTGEQSAVVVNKFVGVLTSVPTNGGAQVVARQVSDTGTLGTLGGYTIETVTSGSANWIHIESTSAGVGAKAAAKTASSILGVGSFTFTPTVAGVYQLTVYNQSGDGASTGAQDAGEMSSVISITVAAAAGFSAGLSTSILNATDGTANATADADAYTCAKAAGNQCGVIAVTINTTSNTALNGGTLSASISGAGLILANLAQTANTGNSRSSSVVMTDTNVAYVHIDTDGSSGPGTITISYTDAASVTTVLATEVITSVGAVTKITRDADTAKTYIGVGDTDTISLLPVDSLDNDAAAITAPVASSSNTLVASVTVAENLVIVTGVSSGTAVITVCNVVCSTTGAISATFPVTVTKTTAKSFTLTFDKATYAPGEKMTLTVAAVDSNGSAVADSAVNTGVTLAALRTLFSSTGLTANAAISGLPAASATVSLNGGTKAFTMFAPLISGDVTISATEGTGVDSVALLASSAKVITATATVSGGSADAALDAANEATDAAYAAADAADNATQAAVDAGAAAALAQESADAALAAVTDLGIKVTGLLDKLSASLANIYKIIKAIQAKQK